MLPVSGQVGDSQGIIAGQLREKFGIPCGSTFGVVASTSQESKKRCSVCPQVSPKFPAFSPTVGNPWDELFPEGLPLWTPPENCRTCRTKKVKNTPQTYTWIDLDH